MVSTPPFAESVTEGDVKWEKGERERTTSSCVAFRANFEGGKRFFLGGVICGHVSLNCIVYDMRVGKRAHLKPSTRSPMNSSRYKLSCH